MTAFYLFALIVYRKDGRGAFEAHFLNVDSSGIL